jgi:hypothetical protein
VPIVVIVLVVSETARVLEVFFWGIVETRDNSWVPAFLKV